MLALKWCSFGIAFDIDGVVLRGRFPIGNSSRALTRLYDDSGSLNVPFLFLTNGGDIPDSRRALELSELLGVNILPSQVFVQGHSPFKNLLKRFENELVVATGKGEPALVMSEYGFKKVLSLDEYASYFENIDPVSQYKIWTTEQVSTTSCHSVPGYIVSSERVKAAFVISDLVLCDILRSRGLPGRTNGHQPPLYFTADILNTRLAAFPSERLRMGAFRIALESIFNGIHHSPLECIAFGKPNPFVFKNAETILSQFMLSCLATKGDTGSYPFETLYMIGDNPTVDIKSARQVDSSHKQNPPNLELG
ncbi:hypothetical protein Ddye_028636 [Dipteronia dyeriana]|uniref:Uncharacterized protein n=1 Tax=Dipteronia dyeriana TaxID=168575 RepID=A0AAD9TE24_9ROSI|nr:hypothetical protein Ddye_028636 [Dipteronia dyeriana]